ncbi:hypothetical protein BDQ12DRAFT_406406 [Crucibulum laeve]|uniref:Uncharacterized protein n=1 Tax=Crucibulum laeve TaxID=68775 RepID=A0A5C3LMM2_9AGAR|nr:hypothetical protein BDQ12DRAFT_406406 [Crucibulum laeve]
MSLSQAVETSPSINTSSSINILSSIHNSNNGPCHGSNKASESFLELEHAHHRDVLNTTRRSTASNLGEYGIEVLDLRNIGCMERQQQICCRKQIGEYEKTKKQEFASRSSYKLSSAPSPMSAPSSM